MCVGITAKKGWCAKNYLENFMRTQAIAEEVHEQKAYTHKDRERLDNKIAYKIAS